MRPVTPRPRASNWPDRLVSLVLDRQDAPFTYGQHDCALFAADAAVAVAGAGADFMAPWRGRYTTEADMAALSAGRTLEACAEAAMVAAGLPECPVAFAQRGDVVLLRWGNEDLLGVVLGRTIVAPGADRLRHVPLSAARRCWAV